MLLNIVNAVVLAIMLGFLSTTAIKADDTLCDDAIASHGDSRDFKASNVLSEDPIDATDDEDVKSSNQHLYSLDDDDDNFD